MKRILFAITMLVSFGAHAATLTDEVVKVANKVCIYSDGSAITVSAGAFCPRTNQHPKHAECGGRNW